MCNLSSLPWHLIIDVFIHLTLVWNKIKMQLRINKQNKDTGLLFESSGDAKNITCKDAFQI